MGDTDNAVNEDVFMRKFKMLKRKSPPADLSTVIDLYTPNSHLDTVTQRDVRGDDDWTMFPGLIPPDQWRIYELNNVPGAIVILNPFKQALKRYLISRCLSDYPKSPNISNLDTSQRLFPDIWDAGCHPHSQPSAKKYLQKLRWVTLGYHYDWTKKIYVKERYNEFPQDLSCLTQYIINRVLGETTGFKAEAAIVNYYHLDSSLSGHTDHSEFDLTAPLISISFGTPCVFMIGGQTKTVEPQALYLRDGDVVIMSGRARMSYHAVPKVLPMTFLLTTGDNVEIAQSTNTDEDSVSLAAESLSYRTADSQVLDSTCRTEGEHCPKRHQVEGQASQQPAKRSKVTSYSDHFTELIECVDDSDFWLPYKSYLQTSRININVRQVFESGKGPQDYFWPTTDPAKSGQPIK